MKMRMFDLDVEQKVFCRRMVYVSWIACEVLGSRSTQH